MEILFLDMLSKVFIKADWSGFAAQSALTPPAYAHVVRLRNPPSGENMANRNAREGFFLRTGE